MESSLERVKVMKMIPIFRGLPLKDLERLASRAREVSHAPGDEIIREGTRGSSVYLITAGTAEVRRSSAKRRLRTMGPGDFFGELSIVSPSPRSATVIATEPMKMLVLQGHDFRLALRENNLMAQRLVTVLAQRLRDLTDEFADDR